MRQSSIKAGLCALFVGIAAVEGAAGAQEATDAAAAQARLDMLDTLAARAALVRAASPSASSQLEALTDEALHPYRLALSRCADVQPARCADLLETLDRLALEWSVVLDPYPAPAPIVRATAGRYASARRADTTGPVVNSMSISPGEINMDTGETSFEVTYDVADPESGLQYLSMQLVQVDWQARQPTVHAPSISFNGAKTGQGAVTITAKDFAWDHDYQLRISLRDAAGNYSYIYRQPPMTGRSTVGIRNSNEDRDAPVINSLSAESDTVTLSGQNDQVHFRYDIQDPGPSGLNRMQIRLVRQDGGSATPIQDQGITFNGAPTAQGVYSLTIPADTPPGDYQPVVFLDDVAWNWGYFGVNEPFEQETLRIINPDGDTFAPRINRLSLSPDQLDVTTDRVYVRIEYDLSDAGGSGLDSLVVRLRHEDHFLTGAQRMTPDIPLNGANHASGVTFLTMPQGFSTGAYEVEVTLSDKAGNYTGFFDTGMSSPQIIRINESELRTFGPFDWVNDTTAQSSDVFRLSGVAEGPPRSITVWLSGQAGSSSYVDETSCTLDIRPERHSGAEYLITTGDLADCGAFGRASLRFEVIPQIADLTSVQTLRRFRISPSGMLTDVSSDRSPLRNRATRTNEVIGPFEWAESSSSQRQHHFLLTSLAGNTLPASFRVSIDNASEPGFEGTLDDCSLPVNPDNHEGNQYRITPEDLAQCGDFGRADLSFEISDVYAIQSRPLFIRRLVVTPQGAVSDLSFDHADSTPYPPTSTQNGEAEIILGPFEWAGDASAPTQNLFRIAGIEGAPRRIDVALVNASASGFSGEFDDCSLTINPARSGAYDYLILQEDLAACGAFGRADLRFRITANESQISEGVRMRRFALGANGDLTDFGFDHDPSSALEPTALQSGEARVDFGTFEWTGDSSVGTQNVFRISGLSGAPVTIQVALENAAGHGFTGQFSDCTLTPRPERSSENDYVILANDLSDCGAFIRADARFRIIAHQDQFADRVQMRRFAVTRTGGLTDFGFDNQ
jgi:hypothetical protein